MNRDERIRSFQKRVQMILNSTAFFLEFIVSLIVIFIVVIGIISLVSQVISDIAGASGSLHYISFLEMAMTIIIGIEFLKMLCRHNIEAVIEVILFYLARQLIVETTTMVEGLICVLSVACLFAVRKYLLLPKENTKDDPK